MKTFCALGWGLLLALLPLRAQDFLSGDAALRVGGKTWRGMSVDCVLPGEEGDIHFSLYVPPSYDGSVPFALFVTLPGWQGLYFQGAGENIRTEEFAFTARSYVPDMIVIAPQLDDWGEKSARQAVWLVRHFLSEWNIDPDRVYLEGYSGGGETASLVMELAPELFAGCLVLSSRWDGTWEKAARARTPVRFVVGEGDEYYGSGPFASAYEDAKKAYLRAGAGNNAESLLTLTVKPSSYFAKTGSEHDQHGGGAALFARDREIMGWLFAQRKGENR